MFQPPSGTVTFLFSDIEGSTKRWESNPDAMRAALARHDELMRESIEANGGFVFKTIGDAFCAAFSTAPEAAAAALAAQLALLREPWAIEPPVRARMALHTGAADERGGDYFGQPVNRVARLLSAGHGGQTLVSLVTQELVRDTLPRQAGLADLGDASLKDLARPERVYQLEHSELPTEFPPLRTLNSAALPNNLPQQPTSFIGREKELAEVAALLAGSRLLTLVGPGGAGKTRLALQAAADLLDGEGDGVWLVELAALADGALVAAAAAQAVGVKEGSGAPGQTVQKTLVDYLNSKRLLIVLDNCEHVIAACAGLASELLRHCADVHIVATSREPLNVSGEQVYRVPSLSMPDRSSVAAASSTAESLSQYGSVQLFIERAKAVQPEFAVTDANAPAVAQICTHLDGIPLAIELAAARVRSLPVEQINARLDQRFRLLTGGARTNLPRQQTLRALIDWSYDLLTDQEKALMARLSVFAGGWTLDAAEAICSDEGGGGIEDWEMLDLLTSLTDKSLVVYEEQTAVEASQESVARYRLLESMRQYGADRLRESGDGLAALKRRHCEWFLRLASEAEPHLAGPEARWWLSRLGAEIDNFRAALSWCEQEGAESGMSAKAVASELGIAGALWRFWFMRGFLTEGRQWLGKALRHAVEEDAERSEEDEQALVLMRSKALTGAGNLAYGQGDYAAALPFHQECLLLKRRLGEPKGIAAALNNIAILFNEQGDSDAAEAMHQESLEIKRQVGDRIGIAASLNNLGSIAVNRGDYDSARRLMHESLEIKREIGDQYGIAGSLNNLGSIACMQGDYAAGEAMHQESLEIKRRMGDQFGITASLNNLAGVAKEQGNSALCLALHRESLTLSREHGLLDSISYALDGIATVAFEGGAMARGARLWSAAAAMRERMGSPLPPESRLKYDGYYAKARESLGDAGFDAAWAAGGAMALEQASDYALSELE